MVIFIREKFAYNVNTVCDKHGYILEMGIDSKNIHDNTLKKTGLTFVSHNHFTSMIFHSYPL